MKGFLARLTPLAAVVCLLAMSLLATEDPLVIETKQGRVRGKRVGKADVFLGIPFAEPPVGELRWRPPVEKKPWQGVREATSYALPAPQRIPNPSGVRQASEDCLYLNVFTPVKRGAGPRLPVMVFLHGGSNVQGNANMWTSGMEDLFVGQRDNVVLVTPQFRLGVIGFLAHPALTAESEHHSSGNYGFLDQIAALRWVHQNIDRFGGDPNRVTVFGSSSGSIDTGALVASPLARGLFHRAIMQSWPMAAPRLADRERHQGLVLAEEAGVSNAQDVAAALRSLPWQKLVEIQAALGREGRATGQGYNPTIDGWALPDGPLDAVRAGKHNHVPFIIGAQSQDARAWASKPIRTQADFQSAVQELIGRHAVGENMEQIVKRLRELYPVEQYESPSSAFVDLVNDFIHTCPDRRIALAMAANQGEPVYWYVLSQALSGEYAKYGADHPLIGTYLFQLIRIGRVPSWYRPRQEYTPTKEDLQLADTLLDYWISFAANGHLRGASSTEWPPVTPGRDATQILRIPVQTRSGYKAEHCACWDDFAQKSRRED